MSIPSHKGFFASGGEDCPANEVLIGWTLVDMQKETNSPVMVLYQEQVRHAESY